MRIIELSECDSTNEYLKRLNGEEDTIVTALRQTAGKGTKGRSFSSADGGLYLSVMRFYENFSAANAFEIMINSCVAVCKTVEDFGITPVIRWANDVLVNGRKICGTLIESPQPIFASRGVFIRLTGTPAALSLALQSIACDRERNTARNSIII